MPSLLHFLRMSQWARNPPSAKRVKFVFAIIAVAAAIWGIELMGWWPDWATANRIPRGAPKVN